MTKPVSSCITMPDTLWSLMLQSHLFPLNLTVSWTKLQWQSLFHPASVPQYQMLSDLQTSAIEIYFVHPWTHGSPFYFHLCFLMFWSFDARATICFGRFSCSPGQRVLWFLACQIVHAITKKSSTSPFVFHNLPNYVNEVRMSWLFIQVRIITDVPNCFYF